MRQFTQAIGALVAVMGCAQCEDVKCYLIFSDPCTQFEQIYQRGPTIIGGVRCLQWSRENLPIHQLEDEKGVKPLPTETKCGWLYLYNPGGGAWNTTPSDLCSERILHQASCVGVKL